MNTTVRRGAAVFLVVLSTACGSSAPMTDCVITFDWEGWSAAGPWGATGSIRGDSLTVEFNLIMQLTDFEDAVYALVPST
jgi:hypothetical protein